MGATWLEVTDAIEHVVTSIGILAGGAWAWHRFGLSRKKEPALKLDLSYTTLPNTPMDFVVYFTAIFKNQGKVALSAKAQRFPHAYDDLDERQESIDKLKFSADLLVRRLPESIPVNSELRWFDSQNPRSPAAEDAELDLLDDYVSQGETQFWMEPGEIYRMSAGLVLVPGRYLAMLTFVGEDDSKEFWRRQFLVVVPRHSQKVRDPV